MSISQRWPLSQTANKGQGACSVCFQHHQLHHKDSIVHLHGPRAARCPGSNKPPLSFSRNPRAAPVVFASQQLSSRRSSLSLSTSNRSAANSPCVDKNRVSSTAAATSPVSSQCSTSIPAAVPADSTPLKAAFSHPKLTGPVLKHIPRSARPACCSALTAILNGIVQSPFNDYSAWNKLMNFATDVLLNPPRTGGQSNIAKCIKDRIAGTSSAAKTCSSAMQK